MEARWMVKPVWVAIWVLGGTFNVSADDGLLSRDIIKNAIAQADTTLPTVEVTADMPADASNAADKTSTSSTADVRPDLAPDSIQNMYRVESTARFGTEVMTKKDIEALHPKDVFDLLDKANGLDLTYQGRKSPYFLNERGGGSLTYILDGALLPTQTNRILQSIPLAAIEQIQIVRGSTSLALGPSIPIGASNSPSGLNTGFVIIRTKRAARTEAKLTASVEKAVSQPTANKESLYAGTHLGEPESVNGYVGGMLSRTDVPSKDTWFDGQDDSSKMATGGFSIGKFSINGMAYKSRAGFEMQRGVSNTGVLDNSKWYYDPLVTTVLSSDMSMQWSENQTTLFSIFKTMYHQHEVNENFTGVPARSDKDFDESTDGYSLRHNARFGNTLLQLGGQVENSRGYGPNTSSNYNNWDTSVKGWSASVEQGLFDNAVTLDAGYRKDKKHIDHSVSFSPAGAAGTWPAQIAARLAANNDVDMAPAKIFTLGARWKINDMFALNGRYFDGDEGASGDFDIVMAGNKPLHAEQQKRREVAFEASPWPYFKPMLTLFDIDIKNQKTATNNTYVVNGETFYFYTENDSHRQGLELLVKGNLAPKTAYSFAWTHMYDNETITNGVAVDDNGIKTPMNLYTARLSHEWDDYRANLSVKKVGAYIASTSSPGTFVGEFGDYTRVDANLARDFRLDGHKLTAKIYGRNLGNDHYTTKYVTGYYYDRGRTLGVEVSAEF